MQEQVAWRNKYVRHLRDVEVLDLIVLNRGVGVGWIKRVRYSLLKDASYSLVNLRRRHVLRKHTRADVLHYICVDDLHDHLIELKRARVRDEQELRRH